MSTLQELFNQQDAPGRQLLSKMHVVTIIPLQYVIAPFYDKTGFNLTTTKGKVGFLSTAVAANLITSTVQTVGIALEAAVAELMFIFSKFWYYKFLLNPQQKSYTFSKLQNVEETSDITVVNTYRNKADGLSFTGISGCTLPRDLMKLVGPIKPLGEDNMSRYPKLSAA